MKKITLKTLLSGLALTLCLVSPLSAQQKRYDGVTIHTNSLGGAWDELITDVVVKPLKEQYGFTVVLHPETITVSLSKLLVDVKNPPYDVFHTDSTTLPTLLETNAVEDLDPKFVPEFANVYPQMKEGGNKAAPWFTAPMVIAYRTDLVKNPPKTMTDLAKPEFKGAVGLYNVENAGGIMDLIALAMENGGDLKNIEPGFKALEKIKPNVVTTTAATTALVQMLQKGEITVASLWYGRVADMMARGEPVNFVALKQPAADIEYVSLMKASKHKEPSQIFINKLMSPEVGAAIAKRFYNASPNKNVQLPPDVAKKVFGHGEEAVKALYLADWKYIAANRADWLARWNRLMAR